MVDIFVPDEVVTAAKLNAALNPVVGDRVQALGANTVATSETVEATATFTIPAAWGGYDVEAVVQCDLYESGTLTAVRVVDLRLRFGTTVGGTLMGISQPEVGTVDPNRESACVIGFIEGQSATGSQSVVFTTQIPADTGQASTANTTMWAKAWRTS